MKALILGAGFGTRLYPLTENTAKPLIEVGGKPIIDHILAEIENLPQIQEIFVVANNKFHNDFLTWHKDNKSSKNIKIINDGTNNNKERLGAVGDLDFVIKKEQIDDDLLVIGGDNLFGFSLQKFVDFFQQNNSSTVAFCDLKDKEIIKNTYGVGLLQGTKVIEFLEKPSDPPTTLASTACYLFSKQDLSHIEAVLQKQKFDNTGDIIKHLAKNSQVHGFVFDEHWLDIGSFASLEKARKIYEDTNEN